MKGNSVNDKTTDAFDVAAALILGAVCFVAVYGVRVLDPTYDAWLLGRGDLTQHYLGWCFYRAGGWTFPIGLTDRLAYPDYSSVIFTDSIPLLAVFFKLLSPVLPSTFQYFGWWGLACFLLQGLFAVKLLKAFHVGSAQRLWGSLFFILSPMVIEKMFRHTALGGHWIILAAIYLFARHRELFQNTKKACLYWGLMGAYIGSVHLYFLPMCGAFACGFVLCSILCRLFCRETDAEKTKKTGMIRNIGKDLLPGAAFAAGTLVCLWLFGGFSTRAETGSSDLGEFSFNLNGFFNARGYSRFLPSLASYRDGQYEGFAYLGLGIFILLALTFVYLIRERIVRRSRGKISKTAVIYGVVYVLMCAGLILFAASPEVTFGDRLLFILTDSSTLKHYWSMFRSSGRIVWPVCYLIYLGVMVCADRFWRGCSFRGRRAAAFWTFVVCAFVQLFDLSGKLQGQRNTFAKETVYESPLQSGLWEQLAGKEGMEHVVWVSHNIDNNAILHIAKLACDHGLTMNNYYFARGINVNENTRKSLENPSESCLYIFLPDDTEDALNMAMEEYGLTLYEADGYILGVLE